MKISVITPSVRPELLEIVKKCLARQTFDSFEWLVVSPFEYKDAIWVEDPPMREGDYYRLNGAWNAGIRKATGDLLVIICDGLWFEPDLLERCWNHFEANPYACISCVGDQFTRIENGKPENRVWTDPRRRTDFGSFYEVGEMEMEFCLVSLPKQAMLDIGGFEEEFDKGAAVSEKEAMARAYKAGYKLYIDQTLEYRAIQHPRLSTTWDEHYHIACDLWARYQPLIESGERLALDYI